jgi:P-type Ca2+ transporter type 2C
VKTNTKDSVVQKDLLSGLSSEEVEIKRKEYGLNELPTKKPPTVFEIFFKQFLSPFIYILLAASVISLSLGHVKDFVFIMLVLLINAVIGTIQEFSAEKSAEALKKLVSFKATVIRDSRKQVIDSKELVPGDAIFLESGDKVPADIRLVRASDLSIDESLLTGESLPVEKDPDHRSEPNSALVDRHEILFAGTVTIRGRAQGEVIATGLNTELGKLSEVLNKEKEHKAPLVLRMEGFVNKIAIVILLATVIVFFVELNRGHEIIDILIQAIALAVSAIPEGLPVAITVALACGVQRMSKNNVVVRKMVAVEALGSCTYIASDKTGTLTVNEMTAKRIVLPDASSLEVTGEGTSPDGEIKNLDLKLTKNLDLLCRAMVLCNEASMTKPVNDWVFSGDKVDIALLVLAHKYGLYQNEVLASMPQIAAIGFESERAYSASVNQAESSQRLFVKGAPEKILDMCSYMAIEQDRVKLDRAVIENLSEEYAAKGFRLLAFAVSDIQDSLDINDQNNFDDLTFIGLVCMIDPLRAEAKEAVDLCHKAGVTVSMVTGDHPITAFAIAKELGLANSIEDVINGKQLRAAFEDSESRFDALVAKVRVFARIEPEQKLQIVQSLKRQGHFVAVTGDGANDAPALSSAHVGVAMGRSGTDLARENAELILTDDNFSSIVAGIKEGRIAYNNIRKVILFLVSCGLAELFLFFFALFFNMELPLIATQLLWLNIVTGGVQHIALALDPAEGDEMLMKPRSPKENIFNKTMTIQVINSSFTMSVVAFALYYFLVKSGSSYASASNSVLLLMVLFENVHLFNCRSENRSVFRQNWLTNPMIYISVIAAQLIHLFAMYNPWLQTVLRVEPVELSHVLFVFGLSLTLLLTAEIEKRISARK